MQIDRRITNGLAWAGVLLVVGVPAADFVTGRLAGNGAPTAQVAVIEEQEAPVPAPAAQRPANQVAAMPEAVVPTRPAPQAAGAVAGYEQSGRPLPSYINDAPAAAPVQEQAVRTPIVTEPAAPVQTATTPPVRQQIITPTEPAIDPVQVASISPKIAPMPMPASMRPRAPMVTQTSAMPQPAVVAPVGEPVYVPPSVQEPVAVTAADLEDWETGPLADFLARRQQQQPQQAKVDRSYDEDGFFLDEGPNGRGSGRDRLVGPELFFTPFSN